MNVYASKVLPIAGLLLVAVAAVLLLLADRTAPPAHGDPPPPPPFAVLDEGESAPLGLVDLVPNEWIAAYELDLEAATSAETPSSDVEVAVVPGTRGVCLVTEAVGGCASWLDAELGRLALVEACSPGLDPGEVRVTGLVPDDAAVAAITRPPAAAVNVSAPLNVYVETLSGDPAELVSSGLDIPVVLPWDGSDESLTTCVVPEEELRAESDAG